MTCCTNTSRFFLFHAAVPLGYTGNGRLKLINGVFG